MVKAFVYRRKRQKSPYNFDTTHVGNEHLKRSPLIRCSPIDLALWLIIAIKLIQKSDFLLKIETINFFTVKV